MSLKSWLFGSFIDKIEWENNDKKQLFFKFLLQDKEVSYNAKLKVKEGEVAIFALNNKVFDTFTFGDYIINRETIPNISKELKWDKNYDEPFKIDIYFINRESFTYDWSTKEPILLHDKDNSIVKVQASGEFKLHIYELTLFMNFILKTESNNNYISTIISIFDNNIVNALVNRKSSIFNLAKDKKEFSQFIYGEIIKSFSEKGFMLDSILTTYLEVEQELPTYTGIYENSNKTLSIDNEVYYIIKNSKADGPYSESDILKLINENKLIAASYIWKDGLENWVKIKDIFDLENLSKKL